MMSLVVKAQDWTAAETALGATAHPSNDASPCRTIRRGKQRPWISTKSLFMSASLAAFGRRGAISKIEVRWSGGKCRSHQGLQCRAGQVCAGSLQLLKQMAPPRDPLIRANVGHWHIASFRRRAALRSL